MQGTSGHKYNITSSDDQDPTTHPAATIMVDASDCVDDVTGVVSANYWQATDSMASASIVVEFQSRAKLTYVVLRNGCGPAFDRGAKDFLILANSLDATNGPWIQLLSATLEQASTTKPAVRQGFYLAEIITATYLKFECVTYYGSGCGLLYFAVE